MISCPNCGNKYLTEVQNVKPYQSMEFDAASPKGVGKIRKNWNDPRRYISYWCGMCKKWIWDRVL